MNLETTIGILALVWLVVSVLLMTRFIRIGRDLSEVLAVRHPKTYEALGRPRPGFFYSSRRTKFAQFVGQREYEQLDDAPLSNKFDTYRKSEARFILSILAIGAIVALLGLTVRYAA
jgi:hypothetical protein